MSISAIRNNDVGDIVWMHISSDNHLNSSPPNCHIYALRNMITITLDNSCRQVVTLNQWLFLIEWANRRHEPQPGSQNIRNVKKNHFMESCLSHVEKNNRYRICLTKCLVSSHRLKIEVARRYEIWKVISILKMIWCTVITFIFVL